MSSAFLPCQAATHHTMAPHAGRPRVFMPTKYSHLSYVFFSCCLRSSSLPHFRLSDVSCCRHAMLPLSHIRHHFLPAPFYLRFDIIACQATDIQSLSETFFLPVHNFPFMPPHHTTHVHTYFFFFSLFITEIILPPLFVYLQHDADAAFHR